MRGRVRLRTVGKALGVALLVLVGFAALATAERDDHPSPDALFLHGKEVPEGLTFDPSASGLLNIRLPDGATYVRTWLGDQRRATLSILAVDTGRPANALSATKSLERSISARGYPQESLDGLPGAVGGTARELARPDAEASEIVFARGQVVILLLAEVDGVTPRWDDATLAVEAARAEQARLARVYTGVAPTKTDLATLLGYLAGGGLAYLVYLGLIAYWRDPLRRDRRLPFLAPSAPQAMVDVTAAARSVRRRAQVMVAIELGAAITVVAAVLPAPLTTRLVLIGAGLAVYWVVAVVRRLTVRAPRGQRSWRAVGLRALGTVLLFLAAVALAIAAVDDGETPGGDVNLIAAACFLAAAGLCHRRARRVAARSAPQALAQDDRAPVVYLRSWGDDALRLRSATLGRLSLMERLSPGRFDSFEEVLARRLSAFGPVIAVNPPGTVMPPIGAARQTMAEDSWQSTVGDWMDQAALIVVSAPPGAASPGLVWELGELGTANRWSRTVIVVPPARAAALRRRWEDFAEAGPEDWVFRQPPPADIAQTLVLTRAAGHWLAFTAQRRNEWAYRAALFAARAALASTPPDPGLEAGPLPQAR